MNARNSDQPISVNLSSFTSSQTIEAFPPLLSSRRWGWKNLDLNYYRYGNCETPVHVLEHHAIGLILDRGKVERKLNGKYQRETTTIGSVAVIPAQVEHWSAWKGIGRFMMFSILPKAIATIDPDIVTPDLVELIPTFAKSQADPLIYGIGMAMKQWLENSPGSEDVYIEHLTNALLAHLLQQYCSRKIKFKEYSGGLSSIKLKQALEYINDNLENKIGLKNIAQELNISPYYFARLFRQSVGVSPYQYVIERRIEQTKQLLTDTNLSLAAITTRCGFTSQSQMTAHFRQQTGTTPKKYRDAGRSKS